MTSAVLARLLKLIRSEGVRDGIPSSIKGRSVRYTPIKHDEVDQLESDERYGDIQKGITYRRKEYKEGSRGAESPGILRNFWC